MILLTVGTQLPFNRLARAVDGWCMSRQGVEVVGQLAHVGRDDYRPRHFRWQAFYEANELDALLRSATFVVGHAGIGTIVKGLTFCKPLVLMPRRSALGEQRNDHQISTVMTRFHAHPLVNIVHEAEDVGALMDRLVEIRGSGEASGAMAPFAEPRLIERIRTFIDER